MRESVMANEIRNWSNADVIWNGFYDRGFIAIHTNVNFFSVIATLIFIYTIISVATDIVLDKRIKKACYISFGILAGLLVAENIIFYIKGMNLKYFNKVCMAAQAYISLASIWTPFVFLLSIEKEKYIHTTKGAWMFMLVSAYTTTVLMNIFLPIYYIIDSFGQCHLCKMYFIRPLLVFILYGTLVYTVIHSRYIVTKYEILNIAYNIALRTVGAYFYVFNYVGEITALIMALHMMSNIGLFRSFSMKRDRNSGLPNQHIYNISVERQNNTKDLVAAVILINGVKEINTQYGCEKGDEYIRSVSRTLNKELKPYGNLYHVSSTQLIFLGTDIFQVNGVLSSQKQKCTNEKYGIYIMDYDYGVAQRNYGEDARTTTKRAYAKIHEPKEISA